MQITLKEIYIRDLVEGYTDNQEEGVFKIKEYDK